MVVQSQPCQAQAQCTPPSYKKVVDIVQEQFTTPPYVTITHAVSQVVQMDEVLASHSPDRSWNGNYVHGQTVFAHAAVVPSYHASPRPLTAPVPRPTNIIAAPRSINIVLLERYIPPTSIQDVKNFFTFCRRSYIVDRLFELSAHNGSLLLVYPTRNGALTLTNKYLGPIIEPFLRKFVLLSDLNTDVAISMSQMAAVCGMRDFAGLEKDVLALCRAIGEHLPSHDPKSRYEVIHTDKANVVLDRAAWKEWYLEQEQPRLRQALIDYHKSGGRMPARRGQVEVTPDMLVREVVEAIRQSEDDSGNAAVEVGVFVIRRSVSTHA
ncbi:uncharacterized protein PV07_04885 [Cladophialophora immunda]|uniref:Uncharacterized protein n=1 Tax=Cladophialophora immunda TaxID=569365 RepID=A0A0D2CD66_9EURO|nr:uncharacterized protein PV07_04885 [Cladophialophora immunda]KIW29038.1 hypothetical protein PV07_04885 [Cladophialophora immunda]